MIHFINNVKKLEYIQLEYLQSNNISSTNNNHIDTEVMPSSETSIDIVFEAINNSQNYQSIFGGDISSTINGFGFDIQNFESPGRGFNWTWNEEVKAACNLPNKYNTKLHLITQKNILTIIDEFNNSQVITGEINQVFTCNNSLYLFGLNRNGFICPSNVKLYSCKIYEGEQLIRDFIPVIKSDGIICLHDKVTKNFFTNQGSGSFITANTP